jgi:cytochrome c peroxidase
MNGFNRIPLLAAVAVLLAVIALNLHAPTAPEDETAPLEATTSYDAVAPLPVSPAPHAGKVELGERLFSDPRLSRDDSIACASCHNLETGGVDRRAVSLGVGGAQGSVNAPTVFNAGFAFAQFWDGRAATLEEQAAGPIHNPVEMASDWTQVLSKLNADESYRTAFAALYPDGATAANVVDAIVAFERTLVTPDSRFDRHLRGEPGALTPLETHGYRRFRELGCASCHQGVLLGGNMFQKFGVLRDYFAGRQTTSADLGRYNVTKREADRHVFKVPSLRNVALTAPYFHDASADSLETAVIVMARHQLGRELATADVDALVAFLRSLTGTFRGRPLE